MIDANLNRATEGLRVLEDYCRFALNDQYLTGCCKGLRHDLVSALQPLSAGALAAARQTEADVGTSVSTEQEGERDSLEQIAAAAWQRVQQALRVIEECLKLVQPEQATLVEQLRYKTYTLAKAGTIVAGSIERLAGAQLYVLTDGGSAECAFAERVQSLIETGVHVIQLRDKRLDDRVLLERARLLRRVIDQADRQPLFIMNDRPDLAVLSRADGVHVGQEELSVHDVRQIVGPNTLVGVSTHDIEQARQAVQGGANYIGCGPTFPSGTKQFTDFPGLDFLRQVAAEIALPAFAIGGITLENLPQVLATGFHRVAVSGAITDSDDCESSARAFQVALERTRAPNTG
jgi:thiamine-phosphate pyrophosphorylase